MARLFEITIWNWEGDVVKYIHTATEDQLSDLEEAYEGDAVTIVIDREWDDEEDDGDE